MVLKTTLTFKRRTKMLKTNEQIANELSAISTTGVAAAPYGYRDRPAAQIAIENEILTNCISLLKRDAHEIEYMYGEEDGNVNSTLETVIGALVNADAADIPASETSYLCRTEDEIAAEDKIYNATARILQRNLEGFAAMWHQVRNDYMGAIQLLVNCQD